MPGAQTGSRAWSAHRQNHWAPRRLCPLHRRRGPSPGRSCSPGPVESGERVTANHAPYDVTIAPDGSVTIGFTGIGAGRAPTALSVNGRSCS